MLRACALSLLISRCGLWYKYFHKHLHTWHLAIQQCVIIPHEMKWKLPYEIEWKLSKDRASCCWFCMSFSSIVQSGLKMVLCHRQGGHRRRRLSFLVPCFSSAVVQLLMVIIIITTTEHLLACYWLGRTTGLDLILSLGPMK